MADDISKDKPKKVEAQKVEPKMVYIKAVYGTMVDPHTALVYRQNATELLKRTGWVDSQLAAGKMQLCDAP